MVKFRNFKILILLLCLTASNLVKGTEIEQEARMETTSTVALPNTSMASVTARYDDYKNMNYVTFFEKCAPKLTPAQRVKAIKIYKTMVNTGPKPINEGNGNSPNNFGKVLPEGGYSFSPYMLLQGPLLEYCGRGDS